MRSTLCFILLFASQLNVFSHSDEKEVNHPFVENKGQWHQNVQFKTELEGAVIFFENNSFHYQFRNIPDYHAGNIPEDTVTRGHVFKAQFVGSNLDLNIKKYGQSDYYNNYYIGNEPSKWQSFVRAYQQIRYENLYNGIDLTVYQKAGYLKYDYIVAPGTSTDLIQVKYSGVEQPLIVDGKLIVNHHLGDLIEEKPFAYQEIEEQRIEIVCNYKINEDGSIGFEFPEGYNVDHELIIDPKLIFSTYSGSVSDNWGVTATYDNQGNGYAGGIVFASNYIATTGAYQSTFSGGVDISIAKFAAEGNDLLYATFLGGQGNDIAHSMVVDSSDNLYLFGVTSSNNYPTSSNAFKKTRTTSFTVTTEIRTFSQGTDIIVSKLSSNGASLLGSTYFGGNDNDGVNFENGSADNNYIGLRYNYGDSHRGEIVLDANSNCYIGTSTSSTNLSSARGAFGGNQDGLILKFNSDLSSLIWSKYIGGTGADAIYSLKVINNNKILIGGGTTSFTSFPTTSNSYASSSFGGRSDGFISIISADGFTVEKSTFMGTSNYDQVYFIEFDRFNGVYALGQTLGGLFSTKNSSIANPNTGQFIVKLDQNLDSLIYSTTFGDSTGSGSINISPTAFLVDQCQNVYASGWGAEIVSAEGAKNLPSNMPRANISLPRLSTTDGNDFYMYVFNREVDSVLYASYFGGSFSEDHVDGGTSRFDKKGIIYQSVCASCGGFSSDFLTEKAFSSTNNSGNCNNALFKFDFEILPRAKIKASRVIGCTPFTVTLSDSSKNAAQLFYDFYGTTVQDFGDDTTFTIVIPGTYFVKQTARDTICNSEDVAEIEITVRSNDISIQTSADTTVCSNDSLILVATTNMANLVYEWDVNLNFNNPINIATDSSIKIVPQLGRNVFYIRVSENLTNPCDQVDSVVINRIDVIANAGLSEDTICEGNRVDFNSTLLNIDNFSWDFDNGTIDTVKQNPFVIYNTIGDYEIEFIANNNICKISDTTRLSLNVQPNNLTFVNLNDTVTCNASPIDLIQNTNGSAQQILWSSTRLFSDTLNNFPNDSIIRVNPTDTSIYYVKITDDFCLLEDSVQVEPIIYQLALPPLFDSLCISEIGFELAPTIIGTDSFRINFGNGSFTTSDSTPLIRYNNPGDYIVELIGSNGKCNFNETIRDTITLLPNNLQQVPLKDTVSCNSVPVILTQNSQGTASRFVWSSSPQFTDTLNSSLTDSSVSVVPTSIQQYYIKISDRYCEKTDTVEVEQIEYELLLGDFPDSVCTPFQQEVSTTIMGLDSFRINYGQNLTTITDPTPIASFQTPGVYTLELKGFNARCNYSETFTDTILVLKGVELNQIPDTLICSGDTVQLQSNSFGTASSFTWDDNPFFSSPIDNPLDSIISIAPRLSTIYYLKADNSICSAFDTIAITTELLEIDVDDFTSICINDTTDIQAFVSASGSPLSFQWSPVDSILSGENTLAIEISPKTDIFYFLETTSQTGCKDLDTVEVEVNEPAFDDAFIIVDDDSLFKGQTAQLTTNRNGSNLLYLWEPADQLNDPTSAGPIASPSQTQLYKVTITDLTTGCIVVAFKRLSVFEVNCGEPDIFIPTAFTPNNDLSNDILYVRGSNLREIDFQLFNRWGELVFETKDLNRGWDGTYKGKEVDPGVFAYQLRAICFDGQEYYTKGNITLIK